MAKNQSGVEITIKAFLPTGKTVDQQFTALTLIKEAKETGDFSAMIGACEDVSIKTTVRSRRVEEPKAEAPAPIINGYAEVGGSMPIGHLSPADETGYQRMQNDWSLPG